MLFRSHLVPARKQNLCQQRQVGVTVQLPPSPVAGDPSAPPSPTSSPLFCQKLFLPDASPWMPASDASPWMPASDASPRMPAIVLHYCTFHHWGPECKSWRSRDTWSNRQIWPWSTKRSRAKANRVLSREPTGHSKNPLLTTQEKTLHKIQAI